MYRDIRSSLNHSFPPKFRRVLIATPSLSYSVSSHYATSLATSSIVCYENKIILDSLILNGECILPMARNICFAESIKNNYDDLVFIDSDQSWNPQALLKILKSKKKVVGVPVPIKNEDENRFNFHPSTNAIVDNTENTMTVERIGTGFLKINSEVIKKLHQLSSEIQYRNKKLKNICEYSVDNNTFVGEDYVLCEKIKKLGYEIWITQNMTSDHHGFKVFKGDIKEYINHFT